MSKPRIIPGWRRAFVAAIGLAGLATSAPALAYVGPGAGLSVIGSILALVGALFLALVGFIWYPIKRWRNATKARTELSERKENVATESNPAS